MNIDLFVPSALKTADGFVSVILTLSHLTDQQAAMLYQLLLLNPLVNRDYIVRDPLAKTYIIKINPLTTLATFKASMNDIEIYRVSTANNQNPNVCATTTFGELAALPCTDPIVNFVRYSSRARM